MKQRLDQYLVEKGIVLTRSKAQELISGQKIEVNKVLAKKASLKVSAEDDINVLGMVHPWVSRGGMKLAGALEVFPVNVAGRVAIDVGASTGGFTDVLLSQNIQHVYAVDVGQGQLAEKLRQDPKVSNIEQQNARYVTADQFPIPYDLIVCDASFISLKLVLDEVMNIAPVGAEIISLIKPQFEVGKKNLGKGGIVKDSDLHKKTCEDIQTWFLEEKNWAVLGVTDSPILGPDGNKEFLIYAQKKAS